MRHALNLPITSEYSDPRLLGDLAHEAEAAGWDGVFVRDMSLFDPAQVPAVIDPWIALTSIALRTKRVHIGPMLAPLVHRRPWKVAREIVALDHLSGGRIIVGVGSGQPRLGDVGQPSREDDLHMSASKLDEVLDIIAGLCSGEPFHYDGEYYHLKEVVFVPRPVQSQIPIWVAGCWPDQDFMRRAARWDGAYSAEINHTDSNLSLVPASPETARTIRSFVAEHRTKTTPFDLVVSQSLWQAEPEVAHDLIAEFADAGVTWLIQDVLPWETTPDQARKLIQLGPPSMVLEHGGVRL